jgi:hypothetical protein
MCDCGRIAKVLGMKIPYPRSGKELDMRPLAHMGRNGTMLWTIAVVILLLWLLGVITSYTLSGFIHILLVVALIVVLVRLIQGRRLIS